jgi:hypothetical protein
MIRETLSCELDKIDRHIETCVRSIRAQNERVARQRERGQESRQSGELLDTLVVSLRTLQRLRGVLWKELESTQRAGDP